MLAARCEKFRQAIRTSVENSEIVWKELFIVTKIAISIELNETFQNLFSIS